MSKHDTKVNIVNNYYESGKLLSKNTSNACRLCLKNEGKLAIFAENSSIAKKIQSCCSLQLDMNDGLPECICATCMTTLDITDSFRTQCAESDRLLRWNLTTSTNENEELLHLKIKKEEVSVSDDDHNYEDLQTLASLNFTDDVKIEFTPNEKKKGRKKKDKSLASLKRQKLLAEEVIKTEGVEKICSKPKKGPKSLSSLCPYCGKIFVKITSLNAHVKKHSSDRPYACPVCPKTFREKARLKEHCKVHSSEKQYPCEVCGKLFKTTYDAKKHTIIVHNRSRVVTCKLCGKQLATNFGFKMHMKTHTGEKAFECEVCKQKFTFKYSLTLHLRIHTGEKPYTCKFCETKFSALKTLREHERIHTGETPYACPVCSKGFSQLSNMKSHFRNNHRGADFNEEYKGLRRKTDECII